MAVPVSKPAISVEEYLRREEVSTGKHEFHEGEILAMSGGTFEHSSVAANIVGALWNRLRGSDCRVLGSNMRVRVMPSERYVYPDATIVCGQPQFDPLDKKKTTILNPRVIIEVLSESTEAYDRGAKFTRYPNIDSFEEYVLVSQTQPVVETIFRQPGGAWGFGTWTGIGSVAVLRSINLELPLAEVYLGWNFLHLPTKASWNDGLNV